MISRVRGRGRGPRYRGAVHLGGDSAAQLLDQVLLLLLAEFGRCDGRGPRQPGEPVTDAVVQPLELALGGGHLPGAFGQRGGLLPAQAFQGCPVLVGLPPPFRHGFRRARVRGGPPDPLHPAFRAAWAAVSRAAGALVLLTRAARPVRV